MVKRPVARKSFWKRNDLVLASIAGVLLLGAWGALLVRQNSQTADDIAPADANVMTVYKRPGCQCCERWVHQLQQAGFSVKVKERDDLDEIRAHFGVPTRYAACHTAVLRGYVIEGHVPAKDIQRLLLDKPVARGIAVPGMPVGSPGMEGPNPEPYEVLLLHADGTGSVFVRHEPGEHN